jgi:hypothetical protein
VRAVVGRVRVAGGQRLELEELEKPTSVQVVGAVEGFDGVTRTVNLWQKGGLGARPIMALALALARVSDIRLLFDEDWLPESDSFESWAQLRTSFRKK